MIVPYHYRGECVAFFSFFSYNSWSLLTYAWYVGIEPFALPWTHALQKKSDDSKKSCQPMHRSRYTAVESHRLDHRRQAELLLDRVLSARQASQKEELPPISPKNDPRNGLQSQIGGGATAENGRLSFPRLGMRVGIAGPPGAGKSSLIEVSCHPSIYSLFTSSACEVTTRG